MESRLRKIPAGEDLAEAAETEIPESPDRRLFARDHGTLPLEVRIALARLLRGPFLERSQTAVWAALVAHEAAARRWLGEVFLELVLDHEDGVAFTRQLPASELPERAPILLRPARLGYFEAVLLLILRERLAKAERDSERALVDLGREELKGLLELHRDPSDTNLAVTDLHVNAVIKRFVKDFKILRKVPDRGEVYEISPVIRYVVTPEFLDSLSAELEAIKARDGGDLNKLFGGDGVVIDAQAGSSGAGRGLTDPLTGAAMPDFMSLTPIPPDDELSGDYELEGDSMEGDSAGDSNEGDSVDGDSGGEDD
jgi:hypothetical protein